MSDSFFASNSASVDGGGIYNGGLSAIGNILTVTDSIFINNSAVEGGGLFNLSGSTATVTDSLG